MKYSKPNSDKKQKLRGLATFFTPPSNTLQNEGDQLSPWEKELIRRLVPEVRKAKRGEIRCPTLIRIGLTNSCRHNCSGCSFANSLTTEKTFLNSNGFSGLLKSIISLKAKLVDLTGGGEPTLHPGFKTFVKLYANREFELAILSNGTWADQCLIDLMTRGFAHIRVNLDANNQKIYDRIHRPTARSEFHRILLNLEKLVSARENSKENLVIGGIVWVNQLNMNFLEEIVSLSRDLGLNYIQFRIRRNGPESLLSEQKQSVDRLLTELRQKYCAFLVYRELEKGGPYDECWLSRLLLSIGPEGDMHRCPHDAVQPSASWIGNIFDQPADKLWLNSEHSCTLTRPNMEICSKGNCQYHYYQKLLHCKTTITPNSI